MQDDISELINWRQLSQTLAGNDTSIRRNLIPAKYQKQVDVLKLVLTVWRDAYYGGKTVTATVDVKSLLDLLISAK